MKRFIKRAFKAFYRRTDFLRRPVRKELQALFTKCVTDSFDEFRGVMEDLILELYRLQDEVAGLKEEVTRLREGDVPEEEEARSAA